MRNRALLLLILLVWGCSATAAPPNVVLVVADDLGWAGVGYHNEQLVTPNIDRLAEEGVRFERFYVSPICSPTRAGLLTGRWPIRFGLMASQVRPTDDFGLDPDEWTLPEMLAEAGYEHRALVGKWHLGDSHPRFHPLRQGFTSFYGCLGPMVDSWTHRRFTSSRELDWWRDEEPAIEVGHATELLTDEAVRFIQANHEHPPFFLMLSYTAAHDPLSPMQEDQGHYTHAPLAIRKYAGVVTGMDRGIGRVLAALDSTGIRENTLVLFLSDNGASEQLLNEPLRGGKRDTYEGAIRVPAIARWPEGGVTGGRSVTDRVGYIDIFPTLESAAGLEGRNPNPLDGVDFLDVARGETTLEPRDWFNYVSIRGKNPGVRMSVTTESWKLLYDGPDLIDGIPAEVESMELYDIVTDPFEQLNRVEEQPDMAMELAELLRAFRALEPEDALH